mgnify:CR=1 FL=1
MNRNLKAWIDSVYHEPFNLFTNNCWHKSRKIIRKARELGLEAKLVVCIVFFRVKFLHNLPVVSLHFYSVIEGKNRKYFYVDVAFDPETEKRICHNEEFKVLLERKIW